MKRPFAVIGFSMLFAVTMSVFLQGILTLVAAILSAAGFAVLMLVGKRQIYRKYVVWSVALLTVALTFLLAFITNHMKTRTAEQYDGQTAVIEGQILDYPVKSYGRYYYEIKVQRMIDDEDNDIDASFRVRMSSSTPIVAEIYDQIRCEVTFYRFTSGFGLSRESSYWADGIVLGAYSAYSGCTVTPMDQKPPGYYFKQLRHTLTKGIQVLLPKEQAALVNAMLLGDREGISEEINANFKSSGITHLVVISGMHMSMISGLLLWVLQALKISRKWRSLIAVCGLILFMLLVGLEPSVIRSGLMIILMLTADMLGREVDSVNSLGVAVALMCLTNPMIGGDVGFLLSVFATLGIVLLYPGMNASLKTFCDRFRPVGRLIYPILSALLISISANILLIPLQIYIFDEITLTGPLATVLLTIPTTILMYSGAMLCLLYLPGFSIFAAPFQFVAGRCADFTLWIAERFSKLSFLHIQFSGTGMIVLACALLLFAVVFLLGRNAKYTFYSIIMCFTMMVLGFAADTIRYSDVISLAVVNQGEASCVIILRNDEASVIALNGYRTSAAAELLSKHGIKKINALILTDDGYEGTKAAVNVLTKYTPKNIYAVDNFYTDKQLRYFLTYYEVLSDTTEVELLEGLFAEVYTDGSVAFALADGLSFFIGDAGEAVEDMDIMITTNPSDMINPRFIVLQTENDIIVEEGLTAQNYLMVAESRTTYIDCFPNNKYLFRREN